MNIPFVPLHVQHPELVKSNKEGVNPSYESARPNIIHQTHYREMDHHRGSLGGIPYLLRRDLTGKLDYQNTIYLIIEAFKKVQEGVQIVPLEGALLSLCLPIQHRQMDPQAAELVARLSKQEKAILGLLFEKWVLEVTNYSSGLSGGRAFPNIKSTP